MCSCFPGYHGDGFHCEGYYRFFLYAIFFFLFSNFSLKQIENLTELNACSDIDECQDPSIAARCVQNAECCNLPAHFVCKCKPGYEGDGEELCTDINECLNPRACGKLEIYRNVRIFKKIFNFFQII